MTESKKQYQSEEAVRVITNAEPVGSFDHEKIMAGVRLLLEGVGLDPNEERLKETPARVARMYDEIFAGLLVDPHTVMSTTFNEGHNDIVIVKDIPFASICEHHLVPFIGKAHVGYLPNKNGRLTGLSKLARIVDVVAKKPQLQERITTQVADILEESLQPRGIIVHIEAEHFCMTMRGVRKPGAKTITNAVRGTMRSDSRTRQETMALLSS